MDAMTKHSWQNQLGAKKRPMGVLINGDSSAGSPPSCRSPQSTLTRWRATQNKTTNSYVIEIAIQSTPTPKLQDATHRIAKCATELYVAAMEVHHAASR
jgi:hypothetical protein